MIVMKITEQYEFTELTPEAVDCCVEHGAANLSGFLSEATLRYIKERGFPVRQEVAETVDAKLTKLMRVFGIGGLPKVSIEQASLVQMAIETIPSFDDPARLDFHTDSIQRNGVSFLIPISGSSARFEFRDIGEYEPEAVTYMPGDILLLRQYIETYNGRIIRRPQIEHRGIAPSPRSIYTVDLHDKHLVTDFTV